MAQRGKKAAKGSAVIAAGAGHSQPEVSHSQDEIAIVRRATEVLGIDYVARWMRSKIPSLDNQTPYTLVKTENGRKQVERVLFKIEHGVY